MGTPPRQRSKYRDPPPPGRVALAARRSGAVPSHTTDWRGCQDVMRRGREAALDPFENPGAARGGVASVLAGARASLVNPSRPYTPADALRCDGCAALLCSGWLCLPWSALLCFACLLCSGCLCTSVCLAARLCSLPAACRRRREAELVHSFAYTVDLPCLPSCDLGRHCNSLAGRCSAGRTTAVSVALARRTARAS